MIKKLKKIDRCAAILTTLAVVDFIYIFFVYHLTYVQHSTLPNARIEELITAIVCLVLLLGADFLRIRYVRKKRNTGKK